MKAKNTKLLGIAFIFIVQKAMVKLNSMQIFFERKLKTFATSRNFNTTVKLLSLSSEK